MSISVNIDTIQNTVTLLQMVPEGSRLLALQNLCQNNGGRWDYAADLPTPHRPCLYEIQVFGVPAMAEDRQDLPRNWLRAASNILEAAGITPPEPERPRWEVVS
ncbi:hypothetical protein [uncultured Tateyamaria sp.]|uniref:hypothetical protein n=1 Tax=uncultured Tateyamaria sp. TaxID=455651 RepID=UPI002623F871|nr:hypothetical protein [uncultured Tateyamaria sp.]